jgi:hypothetical protein
MSATSAMGGKRTFNLARRFPRRMGQTSSAAHRICQLRTGSARTPPGPRRQQTPRDPKERCVQQPGQLWRWSDRSSSTDTSARGSWSNHRSNPKAPNGWKTDVKSPHNSEPDVVCEHPKQASYNCTAHNDTARGTEMGFPLRADVATITEPATSPMRNHSFPRRGQNPLARVSKRRCALLRRPRPTLVASLLPD